MRRLRLIQAIGDSEKMQRAALVACKQDVVTFCRDFCWIAEPRNAPLGLPVSLPYEPWDIQVELLRWLDERLEAGEHGLVEKSRDMGFSWTIVFWTVHKFLFMPGFSAGFTSRKDVYVDRLGDMNALLPKLRYALDHLPYWMRPVMEDGRRWDSRRKECSKLNLLRHPDGGIIVGEVGEDVGRAGRVAVFFVDESAAIGYREQIEAALSQTTNVVIDGSSARGTGNLFYRKRMGGSVKVHRMHWTDDPRKDQQWYDKQVEKFRQTPWIVPQEIDIDYTAGVEGTLIPGAWLEACSRWTPPEAEKHLPYIVGYDPSDGGGDAHGLVTRRGVALGERTEQWWEGGAGAGAARASLYMLEWTEQLGASCHTQVFDGVGIGVAVREYHTESAIDAYAFSSGERASDDDWYGKAADELFVNRKAEAWWRVREAARKTYEMLEGIAEHPWWECLWIPAHAHELKNQLSTPKLIQGRDGRIQVESKDQLARRGVPSPGLADAAVMTYALDLAHPVTNPLGFDEHEAILQALARGM